MTMHTFFLLLASLVLTSPQEANKQPVTLAITVENSTAAAGNDVWIKVALKNDSLQDLDDSGGFSDRTGLDPNFQFDVLDENGKPAAKRVYPHPELETGKAVNRTISRGETLTQEQRVSALYDMNRPGKYTIQVSRRIPEALGSGIVKSNKITVTIIPKS
jgi:hypothetical protein